ncbi:esterase/lipase family protein [Bradyrhizobium murdochi]|uniref:esterase/lipase family protein n=1 Tax=Bradyrhizobium murdochi TaxID=1038859 RepID=UPI000480C88D|nr:hypothetical protein [Bradyrhizobium murdochi]
MGEDVTLDLLTKARGRTHCDIVFVHGLQITPSGNQTLSERAKGNWRHGDNPATVSWADWVTEDHPEAAVWVLGYEANASEWFGASMPIERRATSLLERLWAADVGNRPLALIAHSMGGLLVKEMLHIADTHGVERYKQFGRAARLIVFLATPHQGSYVPNYLSALGGIAKALLRISKPVENMSSSEAHLAGLNHWFNAFLAKNGPTVVSFAEELPLSGLLIVPPASVELGYPGHKPVHILVNHVDITRPQHREHLAAPSVRKHLAAFVEASRPLPLQAPEPDGAPSLTFRTATDINESAVPGLLSSNVRGPIAYHLTWMEMIRVLEERDANFMAFMSQNPHFMELPDLTQRERWAAAEHASLAARIWRIRTRMAATEEGLDRLIHRLRSLGASLEESTAALRTFGRFAALRLVSPLKENLDFRDGAPVPWLLNWKLNEVPNMSPVDLVPMASDTGKRVLGSRYLVLARVGRTERRYEYVVMPFRIAVDLHQNGTEGRESIFYEWVLPQLAYQTHFDFDEIGPNDWNVFVLLGNDNREWYYPSQGNPWPSVSTTPDV